MLILHISKQFDNYILNSKNYIQHAVCKYVDIFPFPLLKYLGKLSNIQYLVFISLRHSQ